MAQTVTESIFPTLVARIVIYIWSRLGEPSVAHKEHIHGGGSHVFLKRVCKSLTVKLSVARSRTASSCGSLGYLLFTCLRRFFSCCFASLSHFFFSFYHLPAFRVTWKPSKNEKYSLFLVSTCSQPFTSSWNCSSIKDEIAFFLRWIKEEITSFPCGLLGRIMAGVKWRWGKISPDADGSDFSKLPEESLFYLICAWITFDSSGSNK